MCLQAPVPPGQPRVENGLEGENVIKNWRKSMGPAQFSSPQDDAVRTRSTHSDVRVPTASQRLRAQGVVRLVTRVYQCVSTA